MRSNLSSCSRSLAESRASSSFLLACILCWGLIASAQAQAPAPAAPTTATLTQEGLDPDEAARLSAPSGQPTEPVTLPPSAERKRLSQLRQTLRPSQAPEAELRIKALEGFLDYDEEDQIIYGPGRTRIRYGRYSLEADKVILDARLQEVQAEGNVTLQIDKATINADSLRYNFKEEQGAAYNASGAQAPVYFRPAPLKKGKPGSELPQFQKVSKQESIFRNTRVTTCDFKVPHYSVKGREVILFQNDRIFFRGATVYIWGVPVLYFPVYTRSLVEATPWFVQVGYNSRSGARARLGYTYHHRTEEPSLETEDEYVTRSAGRADVFVDYLTKLGPGLGFTYDYMFEYGKHKGELQTYNMYTSDREVFGPDLNDSNRFQENERWQFLWRHRTQITEKISLLANIDEFSDPYIFYDVLDFFSERNEDRRRQVVRRSRVALTDVEEAYVLRMLVDVKDRIGLNQYYDFSNPRSDDFDFDLAPGQKLKNNDRVDGISARRWGRVSEKVQFDAATRHLPLGYRPLYYNAELHLYNNLDKGLNVVSRRDDAFVQGAELYQQLVRQWKLSERYVLLAKFGVGIGEANRDGNEDLGGDLPLTADLTDAAFNYNRSNGILTFEDEDGTFLVGRRKRNLDDINPFYAWADSEVRLNARFSDALTGNLGWRYRKTTDDFIGDFYASLGDRLVREDLYNYRIRQHWAEGNLNYRLAHPLITLSTSAGYNLLSRSEVYSREPLAFWRGGVTWSNQRQTLVTGLGTGWTQRQIYDPTDLRATEENLFATYATVNYSPIHQRWYTGLRATYRTVLEEHLNEDETREFTFFTDEEPREDLRWIYGRELGPKYNTELLVRWDKQVGGLREVAWLLQRNLHDAVGILRVGMETDDRDFEERDESPGLSQIDVRLGLKFKLPNKEAAFGRKSSLTLKQRYRQPAISY